MERTCLECGTILEKNQKQFCSSAHRYKYHNEIVLGLTLTSKKCSKCKILQSLDNFEKTKKNSTGRKSHCKSCRKIEAQKRSLGNYYKEYYRKNRERRLSESKRYGQLHQEDKKNYRSIKYYGISLKEKAEILKKQDGRCTLCGRKFLFQSKKERLNIHIDHDHKTGIIRGIIHANCNSVLGFAHDDVQLLQSAIIYLQRFSSNQDRGVLSANLLK